MTVVKKPQPLQQVELDALIQSLRESASRFDDQIPLGKYFNIGLVGCQKGRLETPAHFFLNEGVTVGALRANLAVRYDIASERIRLLFGGIWLNDNKTLGDYGIEEDSQLVVVFREGADDDEKKDESGREEKTEEDMADGIYGTKIEIVSPSNEDELFECMILDIKKNPISIQVHYPAETQLADEWIDLEGDSGRVWEGLEELKQKVAAQPLKDSPREIQYSQLVKEYCDDPCMVTHEALEDEPRLKMPCGHPISEQPLIDYVTFQLVSDKAIEVKCPFVLDDGSKCDSVWEWPMIRFLAPMTTDQQHRLELQSSYNQIESTLDAQKCDRCGILLFREGDPKDSKTQCPNCRVKDPGQHFCWTCRSEIPEDSLGCKNTDCPGNAATRVMEILQNCDRKPIGEQENIPSVRACIKCGQLIHHTEACKHMQCFMCKTYFCFVCLLPYDDQKGWSCGSYSDQCPNGCHPIQTVEVASLAKRVRFNVADDEERERNTRNGWDVGTVVEFFDQSGKVHVWKVGEIVALDDDGRTLCVEEKNLEEDEKQAELIREDRFSSNLRVWLILRDAVPRVSVQLVRGSWFWCDDGVNPDYGVAIHPDGNVTREYESQDFDPDEVKSSSRYGSELDEVKEFTWEPEQLRGFNSQSADYQTALQVVVDGEDHPWVGQADESEEAETKEFRLEPDETIVCVIIRSGAIIDGIGFQTNQGREVWFGGQGGSRHEIRTPVFCGISMTGGEWSGIQVVGSVVVKFKTRLDGKWRVSRVQNRLIFDLDGQENKMRLASENTLKLMEPRRYPAPLMMRPLMDPLLESNLLGSWFWREDGKKVDDAFHLMENGEVHALVGENVVESEQWGNGEYEHQHMSWEAGELLGFNTWSENYLNAMEVIVKNKTFNIVGTTSGTKQEFRLEPNEKIISMSWRTGYIVDGFSLTTSNGRTFKAGGDGGSPHDVEMPLGLRGLILDPNYYEIGYIVGSVKVLYAFGNAPSLSDRWHVDGNTLVLEKTMNDDEKMEVAEPACVFKMLEDSRLVAVNPKKGDAFALATPVVFSETLRGLWWWCSREDKPTGMLEFCEGGVLGEKSSWSGFWGTSKAEPEISTIIFNKEQRKVSAIDENKFREVNRTGELVRHTFTDPISADAVLGTWLWKGSGKIDLLSFTEENDTRLFRASMANQKEPLTWETVDDTIEIRDKNGKIQKARFFKQDELCFMLDWAGKAQRIEFDRKFVGRWWQIADVDVTQKRVYSNGRIGCEHNDYTGAYFWSVTPEGHFLIHSNDSEPVKMIWNEEKQQMEEETKNDEDESPWIWFRKTPTPLTEDMVCGEWSLKRRTSEASFTFLDDGRMDSTRGVGEWMLCDGKLVTMFGQNGVEQEWEIFRSDENRLVQLIPADRDPRTFLVRMIPGIPAAVPLKISIHMGENGDVEGKNNEWVGELDDEKNWQVEGFTIVMDPPVDGLGLEYMTRLETTGDTPWVAEGEFCGSRGENRKVQGFAVRLTGEYGSRYEVKYRSHERGVGNSRQFTNGEFCGLRGEESLNGIHVVVSLF